MRAVGRRFLLLYECFLTRKCCEQDLQGRDDAKEKLGKKLTNWSGNSTLGMKNIRALLATLHGVIWEGAKWKQQSLADVVQAKRVRLSYRKAIRICHPDRHQNAAPDQKYIAERVFEALNAAYKIFEETELNR